MNEWVNAWIKEGKVVSRKKRKQVMNEWMREVSKVGREGRSHALALDQTRNIWNVINAKKSKLKSILSISAFVSFAIRSRCSVVPDLCFFVFNKSSRESTREDVKKCTNLQCKINCRHPLHFSLKLTCKETSTY